MKPIAFLAIVAVVLVGGWMIYTRTEPVVDTRADALIIYVWRAWPSRTIPIDDITGLSLENSVPRVLGSGLQYVKSTQPPFLKVQTRREAVYINYREPARTKEVYERITAAINK